MSFTTKNLFTQSPRYVPVDLPYNELFRQLIPVSLVSTDPLVL